MNDRSTDPVGWKTALTALALFAFALVPRTANIGDLSLYADEDLSAHAAAAVADGGGSVLPSGMEYRRAYPFTLVTGLWLQVSGDRSERAIRLPSALLGAATIPALFLLGRRWMGFGAGLTAALLLGVSEWHLVFSRQARMYVPLLLFVVLATAGLWAWTRTGRTKALVGGLAAVFVALMLHKLGILVVAAPLVWLAFPGAVGVSLPALVVVSTAAAAAGWAIGEFFINVPYSTSVAPPVVAPLPPVDRMAGVASLGPAAPVLAALGLALAVVIVRRLQHEEDRESGAFLRRAVRWVLALAAGLAAGTGQLYAFTVAGALFFLVTRQGVAPVLRRSGPALLGLLGLLALYLAVWSAQIGLGEALKVAASVPYPHAHTLVLQTPIPVFIFGVTTLVLVLFPFGEKSWGIAAAALLAIAMLAAIGLVREAGPTRYLLTAYPLMMLVAGAGIYVAARWIVGRTRGMLPASWSADGVAVLLSSAVVLSGVLGHHGVPDAIGVANLRHGDPVNELVHVFGFRPDHRSVGRFVSEQRGPDDVVVAVDPLVQRWYAGPVDYWFRRYDDMRRFLRVNEDGALRDIYVGSSALWRPSVLDSLAEAHPARVWYISSGETVGRRRFYFSADQRVWADSLRAVRRPSIVGEDGVTAAYCLNCPQDLSSPHEFRRPTRRSPAGSPGPSDPAPSPRTPRS